MSKLFTYRSAQPIDHEPGKLTTIAVQHRYESWAHGALWCRLGALFGGDQRCLRDLHKALDGLKVRGQHYGGIRNVPITQIRGSEGRAHDFDANFRPSSKSHQQRWQNIALAWEEGIALPPVELIALGDCYFVRDGHHRISVAAAYGASMVEALVTVWEVDRIAPAQQEVAPCTDAASCYA